mmetsp:Transcript_9238/g.22727  ORF Transcript_9238/g.22727 Transcript_9238/m.22727 type:complete len:243 (-) Transcript_9238:153-881(-)
MARRSSWTRFRTRENESLDTNDSAPRSSTVIAARRAMVIPAAKGCPGVVMSSSYRTCTFVTVTMRLPMIVAEYRANQPFSFSCLASLSPPSPVLLPATLAPAAASRSSSHVRSASSTLWRFSTTSSAAAAAAAVVSLSVAVPVVAAWSSFSALSGSRRTRQNTLSTSTMTGSLPRLCHGTFRRRVPSIPACTRTGRLRPLSASGFNLRFFNTTSPFHTEIFSFWLSKPSTQAPRCRRRSSVT